VGALILLLFYLDMLTDVCAYVLWHMAKPPDFANPRDDAERLQYDKMRSIVLCFVTFFGADLVLKIADVF
jgi:hypothetical protein